MAFIIGVDVGTSSVRASLLEISANREITSLQTDVQDITTWNHDGDFYEQSSTNIWSAVCTAVQGVIKESGADVNNILGIGFDATCSLVALDRSNNPITISQDGDNQRNIIMWMDHRAKVEAAAINDTKHDLLNYVGGQISMEMELPKISWLMKNLPHTWKNIGSLMDLPDFLTFKATGFKSRSLCSLVCKWAYDCRQGDLQNHSWCEDFLQKIGLEELGEDKSIIGEIVYGPGQSIGDGLSEGAAADLGLRRGLPVGASLIDAHAGGVGLLMAKPEASMLDTKSIGLEKKLSLICGTSSCFMASSLKKTFVAGVWGPYYSAMVPGYWLSEGGQSATGKALDHIIKSHPVYNSLCESHSMSQIHNMLQSRAMELAEKSGVPVIELTRNMHVVPDFHGNRSPLADPEMTGVIAGLTLTVDFDNLVQQYLAMMQSLIYGMRHTVDHLKAAGFQFECVQMCGGLTRNSMFVQSTADILQLPVILPREHDSTLLGAAVLGLCAHTSLSISDVVSTYTSTGVVYPPRKENTEYHNRKYKVFRKMIDNQLEYRKIMCK